MSAELLDALRQNPLRQEWVDELRDLLDLIAGFSNNDQRARFLLSSNFLRDNGSAIAERSRRLDVELGGHTIFEVAVACDSGCGREVTHHGIAATDETAAREIAIARMAVEGWVEADGFHCRACMLARSGWQSQPGPAQAGHAMSIEALPEGVDLAVTTDASAPGEDRARAPQVGAGDPSIVRALTAQFTDLSRAECRCASSAGRTPLSQVPAQSVPVATQSYGLAGGGEAGTDPNFQE